MKIAMEETLRKRSFTNHFVFIEMNFRFSLLYYSMNSSSESTTRLTVDTRETRTLDKQTDPPLEVLIQTKWEDEINLKKKYKMITISRWEEASVTWNGQEPYY